jgi:DNA mismatch repair protein MutL
MRINVLDEATIGKIAAGEAIERPASVVKELIENALDANARSIRIEIEGGGRDLIRVRDDGDGIAPDDLSLAIQRHATSKVRSFDDLERLQSYGFRGEALASVAAVADLQITSRPADQLQALELRVPFGRATEPRPHAAAPGTTITVRDLFANVPARRKFLRQDATESGYVQRAVAAAALAFPEVRFELLVDRKVVLASDGSGDLRNAVVGVLGSDIAAQMIPVAHAQSDDAGHPLVRVAGLVGLPAVCRGNRQHLYLLVNRRWIENRQLAFALEQAYHTLLMVGRYPVAVLNIQIPPDRVDVNVHPAKREVRFSEERLVFAALQRAVRTALVEHTPAQSIPTIVESPLSPSTVQRRLTLANPERAPVPEAEGPDPESETPLAEARVAMMRVLGQGAGTYIIAEGPDGMYLIDQHAAHERILLERLLREIERQAPESQRLLEPMVVELGTPQRRAFEDARDDLARLGFDVEEFGAGALALRAVPAVTSGRDPRDTLAAVLDEVSLGGRGTSRLESLAMSAACHSAIRAGQTLSLPEMRELILQLETCTAPRACAHGRPTMLHLSQDELERQFSRR